MAGKVGRGRRSSHQPGFAPVHSSGIQTESHHARLSNASLVDRREGPGLRVVVRPRRLRRLGPGRARPRLEGRRLESANHRRQGGADESLPIRKIVLYRSGVGYFERDGQVGGNAEVQLRFNTDQINDILKSMLILDFGGKVESVSYGSKEPLAKRLASFGINIADNPGAAEILQRLRGTPVKIMMADGEFTGTIMNVENRPTVYQSSGGATHEAGHRDHAPLDQSSYEGRWGGSVLQPDQLHRLQDPRRRPGR